jgi:DNA-binding NtrC family response regulator
MTAWGSIELAVKGMKAGAFDFITKPWNNAMLLQRIETALELNARKDYPFNETDSNENNTFDRSFIIGDSKELKNILDIVKRVAKTNASVLITGESGTGKELIAEAIHKNSLRRDNSFIKVNLGGISQTLFESEMFGHKKGAFTDASADRTGRFELADKGTIFLDEIGELDLGSQVKLLRVLQDQTFEPLGDSHTHKVDVRIVSATNVDLQQHIREHTFREDLYYRINLINIHIPPLRERREDIPLLARHFADNQCKTNNLPKVEFSNDAIEMLCRLPYSGNIRELKNLIERTILISGKNILDATDFKNQLNIKCAENNNTEETTLDDIERRTIITSLQKNSYNLSHVAKDLGLSRASLYRRLDKYNIEYKK